MAARPTLLGIPYDASSSYLRGAASAPPVIRKALHSPAGNPWSERLINLAAPGSIGDDGDLGLPATSEARALIEQGVRRIVSRGDLPIALGGDHSITYPLVRGIAPAHQNLTILHVDSHPDLYDEFEGDRYSHACPFARIMEEGLVSRLVQVGIRAGTEHQRDQARRFGAETIDIRAWSRGARPTVSGPVYVSVDLDGIDPAFAPGVSHREPGGLTARDVLDLIQSIDGRIIGADVVELNPTRDVQDLTALVAAKIVKELASAMLIEASGSA
jgi:arginase